MYSLIKFYLFSAVKNLPLNAGDEGSVPGSGRSPGEGNGNPFQYSCLENPMDRGAWWVMVHGVTESDMTEHVQTTTIHLGNHHHNQDNGL